MNLQASSNALVISPFPPHDIEVPETVQRGGQPSLGPRMIDEISSDDMWLVEENEPLTMKRTNAIRLFLPLLAP
jgi:hypothetical protein